MKRFVTDSSGAGTRSAPERAAAEPVTRSGWRVAAGIAYPVVILCAWHWDSPRVVGLLLLALLWMQRATGAGPFAATLRRLTALDWAVAGALSVASVAIVLTGSERLMRLYPSLVSLGLLVAFGATLVKGPSMIEKFARRVYADPPAHIVRYTRRVTWVWCAFFALNGAGSVYTALASSRATWSLYNGVIAYGLIGALLVGEIAWRRWIMLPRAARRGLS